MLLPFHQQNSSVSFAILMDSLSTLILCQICEILWWMHKDVEHAPPFWKHWNRLDVIGKLALPYSNFFVTTLHWSNLSNNLCIHGPGLALPVAWSLEEFLYDILVRYPEEKWMRNGFPIATIAKSIIAGGQLPHQ